MGAMSSVKILSAHQKQLLTLELVEETALVANSAPTRKCRTINTIAPIIELHTARQTTKTIILKRCASAQ